MPYTDMSEWINWRCQCGRFVKKVTVILDGLDNIKRIEADCSRCGHVKNIEPYNDFAYEDVVPQSREGCL